MSAEFRLVILSDSDEENSPPATQSSTTAEASQPPQKRKRVRVDYEDPRELNAEQFDEWRSKEKGNWIRKKVSFRAFVDIVEKVVNRWLALPDYSEVAIEPKISPDTYVQAYQLSSAREGRLQVGADDGRFVLVPSSKNKDVSTEQLLDMDERLKQMRVDSWSEYIELRMGFYVIDPSGQWFRCTCPVGMKKSICKHGLHLMCSKKLKAYPPDTKAVPIEPRRVKKRGRPKKEKPQIRF